MTTAIIVIVLLVLAAAAAVVMMRARQAKRREGLQERFGPEYDRAVESHGDQKAAEKRLAETAARRDQIEIRTLEPAERERYTQQWTGVQAAFVDEPGTATRDADQLVQAVMRDRGYPVDDFATRAEMLATDHPEVVEHYRAAHAVGARHETADTESLRQAFVHYRALFELLLHDGHAPTAGAADGTSRADGVERTGSAAPAATTADGRPLSAADGMGRTSDVDRTRPTDPEGVDVRDQPSRRTP
jgi:hypothetical protein